MEEKSQKDKINEEKQNEIKNNENIEELIDIIGLHTRSSLTQKYFQFVKEVRKYRKKIHNKKEKLENQNMLETAYFEKNGTINKKINSILKNNKGAEPWFISGNTVYGNSYYGYIPEICPRDDVVILIREANSKRRYIENIENMFLRQEKVRNDIESEQYIERLIYNHYAIINIFYMKCILEYYDEELEYWKHYLKQIEEKIERIEELE